MAAAAPPSTLVKRLDTLAEAVQARTSLVPRVGVVLGSGLGELAADLEEPVVITGDQLRSDLELGGGDPAGWPAASAPGHVGNLLVGRLESVPVVCLQGRFHLYEGHSPATVVLPVLLMGRLGASVVLLTNAAGGIDPSFEPGTLMVVRDHLNLTGVNPLVGPNDGSMGPRFPDLADAWSPRLRALLHAAAAHEGIGLVEGVYAGLLGPNYETPAEVAMLRTLGADAVGMSTVLEAIAARWAGLEVCGVSLITNLAAGVTGEPLSHDEVLVAAREAGPRLARILRRFVHELGEQPTD